MCCGQPRSSQAARTDVPFLVLDLGFNIVDGVGGLDLEGDGLSGEGLDKYLHAIRRAMQINRRNCWKRCGGRTLIEE